MNSKELLDSLNFFDGRDHREGIIDITKSESKDDDPRAKDTKSYDNKGWRINGWSWINYADYKRPDMECQYCHKNARYIHKIIHPNKQHSEAFVGCECARKLCDYRETVHCPHVWGRIVKTYDLCKDYSLN